MGVGRCGEVWAGSSKATSLFYMHANRPLVDRNQPPKIAVDDSLPVGERAGGGVHRVERAVAPAYINAFINKVIDKVGLCTEAGSAGRLSRNQLQQKLTRVNGIPCWRWGLSKCGNDGVFLVVVVMKVEVELASSLSTSLGVRW